MRVRLLLSGFLGGVLLPLFAVSAGAQLLKPDFDSPEKYWIEDKAKHCWAANPEPQQGETVTWSGAACDGAVIGGDGVLTWFLDGKVIGKDSGTFRNGMLWGQGRLDFADGAFYVGAFPGVGTITLSDGRQFPARSVSEKTGWSIVEAAPGAVR